MCLASTPDVPPLPAPPPAPPPPPPPPPPQAGEPEASRETPRPVDQTRQAARRQERRAALAAAGPSRATVTTSGRGVTTPGNQAKRTLLGS